MATTTPVLAAALAGGVIGGTFVGVACWVVARGIMPPTVIVQVQSPAPVRERASLTTLDEWTPLEQPAPQRQAVRTMQSLRSNMHGGGDTAQRADLLASVGPVSEAPAQTGSAVVINNLQVTAMTNAMKVRFPPASPQSAVQTVGNSDLAEALSYAFEAAQPMAKEGFTVREDYWGGTVANGERVRVPHQLFKGNEYWFWAGTSAEIGLTVQVTDKAGKSVAAESWSKLHMGAAWIRVPKTGVYEVVIEPNSSVPNAKAPPVVDWALVYGFR